MKITDKFNSLVKYGKGFQDKDKKKKWAMLIGGLFVIFLFMNFTSENKDTKPQPKKESIRSLQQVAQQKKEDASMAQAIVTPGSKVNSQDIWMVEGQKKISEVAQVSDQTAKSVNQLGTNQVDQDKKIQDLNQKLDSLMGTVNTQQEIIAGYKGNASNAATAKHATNTREAPQIQEIDMDSSDSDDNSSDNGKLPINLNQAKNNQANNTPLNNLKISEKDRVKDYSEYIPSNTFVQANLIEGISANTGGNANSDPTPVLMRLTNLAQLPNFFRANVKNCMVGGSGFGDLSTERVKIRLDKLSCVTKNGSVIDIAVKGHVSGEDGKAGIRGVVVSHAGSALAKAALAGGLASLGSAAQTSTQTQMVSPIGVTNTVNPNQAFGSAAAGGAAGGFNTLSQYYTNMLNQISPSIEVSSGRNVIVVFQEGITLKVKLSDTVGNDTPLPFNAINQ